MPWILTLHQRHKVTTRRISYMQNSCRGRIVNVYLWIRVLFSLQSLLRCVFCRSCLWQTSPPPSPAKHAHTLPIGFLILFSWLLHMHIPRPTVKHAVLIALDPLENSNAIKLHARFCLHACIGADTKNNNNWTVDLLKWVDYLTCAHGSRWGRGDLSSQATCKQKHICIRQALVLLVQYLGFHQAER